MISLNMYTCKFWQKLSLQYWLWCRYFTLPFIATTFRSVFNYHIQHFFFGWWGEGLASEMIALKNSKSMCLQVLLTLTVTEKACIHDVEQKMYVNGMECCVILVLILLLILHFWRRQCKPPNCKLMSQWWFVLFIFCE